MECMQDDETNPSLSVIMQWALHCSSVGPTRAEMFFASPRNYQWCFYFIFISRSAQCTRLP